MLSFAVFVALIAVASAATPLLVSPQSHHGVPIAQSTVQRFGKGFSYTTMTGHPSVAAGVYPGASYPQYSAATYPYNPYNTAYPYTTANNYPYAYNTAAGLVQSVPAMSTIGVKPVVGQTTFVQPTAFAAAGQMPSYYYSGHPSFTNTFPHHQQQQFRVHQQPSAWMTNQHGAQVAVAH